MARNGTVSDRFALALASGQSLEAAARAAGISKRTGFRRLEDPAFLARIQELRRELFSRAVAKLTASTTKAADTLAGLLDSEDERVGLAASVKILELARTLRQTTELEDRLTEVERRLNHKEGTRVKFPPPLRAS